MVFQCTKLIYSKVSSGLMREDSQRSYSFRKIQNVGGLELPEVKNGVSLGKDFTFLFNIYFSTSLTIDFLVSHT